jgi:hypothetical protein
MLSANVLRVIRPNVVAPSQKLAYFFQLAYLLNFDIFYKTMKIMFGLSVDIL